MKKTIAILVVALAFVTVAYASMSIYEQIDIPKDFDDHDAEIYRQGYMAGYYAAQYGIMDERHPENAPGHYIVNTKSGIFHYPSCNGVQSMSENNKLDFYGSRNEAIESGYTPCGMCDP